ncbi:hypothetical protein CcaverHIS631_0502870 [Cutaneotrichosporon cavernicola]|nr:hypothetical protein CcaverHIS631_0502870 [Cutaneotrichosporon cavernicola]BEJ08199.1 hypothetical protein CcaverHIS641_0502840 [Cutaneotrichosporon cavernicola]
MKNSGIHPANRDEPPTYEEATSNIDLRVVAAPASPHDPPAEATPVADQGVTCHLTSAAASVRTDLGCAAVDVKRELKVAGEEVAKELADAYTEVQKGIAEVGRSLFGFGQGPCPSRSKYNRRSSCGRSLTGCKRKEKC